MSYIIQVVISQFVKVYPIRISIRLLLVCRHVSISVCKALYISQCNFLSNNILQSSDKYFFVSNTKYNRMWFMSQLIPDSSAVRTHSDPTFALIKNIGSVLYYKVSFQHSSAIYMKT